MQNEVFRLITFFVSTCPQPTPQSDEGRNMTLTSHYDITKLLVGLRACMRACVRVEKSWGSKCQVIPGINALMKTNKFTSRTGSGAPLLTNDCSFLAVCSPLFWKIFTRSSQWRSSWERNFNCSGSGDASTLHGSEMTHTQKKKQKTVCLRCTV